MTCENCNCNISDPWMKYMYQGKERSLCSYLCWRNVPTMIFNHMIINKDDFDDLRPIQQKRYNRFSMYTSNEFNELLPDMKEKYLMELENFRIYNSERADILDKIISDIDYIDSFEYEMEDEIRNDDEEYVDDY